MTVYPQSPIISISYSYRIYNKVYNSKVVCFEFLFFLGRSCPQCHLQESVCHLLIICRYIHHVISFYVLIHTWIGVKSYLTRILSTFCFQRLLTLQIFLSWQSKSSRKNCLHSLQLIMWQFCSISMSYFTAIHNNKLMAEYWQEPFLAMDSFLLNIRNRLWVWIACFRYWFLLPNSS